MFRTLHPLQGPWKCSVNGGPTEERTAPFSAFCAGETDCLLTFDRPLHNGRTLLCFEGITYDAEVFLGGQSLGRLLPYCRYRFDVTEQLEPHSNELRVLIRDIDTPYSSECWENYSGLIRAVSLLCVPETYLHDVFWYADFAEDFQSALCHVKVEGGANAYRAELLWNDAVVSAAQGEGPELVWRMDHPLLWSPETPNLYTLRVSMLGADGTVLDQTEQRVGFKELKAAGNRFVLNGRPLFLRGVCRHDMWGHTQGHTLTDEQIRQDLQLIRSTGANFVRLVHYPHDPRVIEMADEIGLLVSEEPAINGLYGLQGTIEDEPMVEPGLEILKRTILRDRSHVSVAFWLVYNECVVTADFIRRSVQLCKSLDPTRLVSGASCMKPEMNRERFTEGGFDFYTHHPYGPYPNVVAGGVPDGPDIDWEHFYCTTLPDLLALLSDKPLIFTEWGGLFVMNNPNLFGRFLDFMIQAWHSTEPGKVLAGMSYWNWADIYEENRTAPDCHQGILTEGLVDVERNPRMCFEVFKQKMPLFDRLPEPAPGEMEICARFEPAQDTPLDLSLWQQSEINRAAWKDALEKATPLTGYLHRQMRRMANGPVLPAPMQQLGGMQVQLNNGIPLVVSDLQPVVKIPLNQEASEAVIIGHVCLNGGCPLPGSAVGEVIARYVITREDGTEETIPLRNAREVSTVFGLHLSSRIDPRAACAPRAMKLFYDRNWEIYCLNHFTLPLTRAVSLRVELAKPGCDVLLYGITLRK